MIDKIILGTVQFGLDYGINNPKGKVQKKEVHQILDVAHAEGLTLLDTADAYGNASDIIGDYHQKNNRYFDIITKFKSNEERIQNIESLINKTLERIGTRNIWAYLFHSFNDYIKYKHLINQLENQKSKGKIKNIGVSIYTNEQFEEVLKNDSIDVIQLPYNLLDNNTQRGTLLEEAKEKGKIIHVRSVFLQGLFFKQISNLPEKLKPLSKNLEKIKSITQKHDIPMADLALKYVLANPCIDGILIGVDNKKQFLQNINAIAQPLDKKIQKEIDSIHVDEIDLLNPSNWS